jgi:hypothetical protein
MTDNAVEAFVDAILADRPPRPVAASPDDTDLLRVAIELRAGQAEFACPDPQFVEELHRRLAATAHTGADLLPLPSSTRRGSERDLVTALGDPRRRASRMIPRRLGVIGKAAAAAALVAGTFGATNLVGGHSAAPVAQRATSAQTVRSADLVSVDGRSLGRSYAYTGNPSWVFIDVQNPALNGAYACELHLVDGTTVPAGLVVVYDGTGDWAHTVKVQVNQLRQATLVTPTGVTVASATFS